MVSSMHRLLLRKGRNNRSNSDFQTFFEEFIFCCFWINVTQINFENIKRKIQRIISDSCFQLKSWFNVDARVPSIPLLNFPFNYWCRWGTIDVIVMIMVLYLRPFSFLSALSKKIPRPSFPTCTVPPTDSCVWVQHIILPVGLKRLIQSFLLAGSSNLKPAQPLLPG